MEVELGISGILFVVLIALALGLGVRALHKASQRKFAQSLREMNGRMEALFATGYPELQPHFHPRQVAEYAMARRSRKDVKPGFRWENPPGFTLAAAALLASDPKGEKTRLVDKAGATLAEFLFEPQPTGAVLRVGKGKLTVDMQGPEPKVKYWHPEREFKWTPSSWNLKSGLAEQSLASRPRGAVSSSDHDHDDDYDHDDGLSSDREWSSSTSAMAGGAAAGAGAAMAASSMGEGDSAPDFSGVESGSSSTATTY
jgi:hypothetical protein